MARPKSDRGLVCISLGLSKEEDAKRKERKANLKALHGKTQSEVLRVFLTEFLDDREMLLKMGILG